MKIAVVGAGYVGLANAVLLAQHHEVVIIDINAERIACINHQQSPVIDHEIESYLKTKCLTIRGTLDKYDAYQKAMFIIIATSTDYDSGSKTLNTCIFRRKWITNSERCGSLFRSEWITDSERCGSVNEQIITI